MMSFDVLSNIRSLRTQARDIDLETLEELLSKFTAIVEERRAEDSKIQKEQAERLAKLDAIRAQLLEDGINPAELLESVKSKAAKAKRDPRPAKYKYINENGTEQTWTGQGRTPKAIREAIDCGSKMLEDFKI
ncbi:MAG: H-NS family histone-like protein [Symbiopectobacterium sp.]